MPIVPIQEELRLVAPQQVLSYYVATLARAWAIARCSHGLATAATTILAHYRQHGRGHGGPIMYYAHWGLTDSPFTSRPEGRAYVGAPASDEALARLDFLADGHSQGGLLLGASGSGKTLLMDVFARRMRKKGTAVGSLAASGGAASPLFALALQLGCSLPVEPPPARLAAILADRGRELAYERTPLLVLADDAERLDRTAADAVVALLAAARGTLVLATRPEALHRVDARLIDRVELRIELAPWDEEDVATFLAARLAKAGGYQQTFDRRAVRRLVEISGGIPRRVSQLAHLALLAGAGKELPSVDPETVEEAWRELSVAAG